MVSSRSDAQWKTRPQCKPLPVLDSLTSLSQLRPSILRRTPAPDANPSSNLSSHRSRCSSSSTRRVPGDNLNLAPLSCLWRDARIYTGTQCMYRKVWQRSATRTCLSSLRVARTACSNSHRSQSHLVPKPPSSRTSNNSKCRMALKPLFWTNSRLVATKGKTRRRTPTMNCRLSNPGNKKKMQITKKKLSVNWLPTLRSNRTKWGHLLQSNNRTSKHLHN